jgi:outer membrane protein assembly factor BamB
MWFERWARSMVVAGALFAVPAAWAANNWPDFRGPTADGHAPADCKPPIKWSDSENIKWKTPIPGQGWSSPIIWGDQIWITTALNGGKSLRAICCDLNTGKLLHDVELFTPETPGPKHNLNSYASPSATIEEGRVYVSFGTHGIACLDSQTGKVVWKQADLGLNFATGAGSSPLLYKHLLILECDAVNEQYVIARDKATGAEVWRTKRSRDFGVRFPEKRRAFSTGVIVQIDGRDTLLSIGGQRAYAYDPATGKELWHVDTDMGYSNVCRPLLAGDRVLISTGYDASRLMAVSVPKNANVDAPTDLTKSGVAWTTKQGIPYKPSLTLIDGRVYMVADTGMARCVDPKTGDSIWNKRLGQTYSASPVYAGGHLYFCSEKGQVHVLKPAAGGEAEVVSEFTVEEGFMASPAVVGNALILRSTGHLYRVE